MALNVLVVDDSAVMRKMIIKTLRLSGVPLGDIHEAGNGREGLSKLDTEWIDFALVDINMPVMNGEEMIDAVRESETIADLPIVVVSTERSEIRLARLREKVSAIIHKPFTPEKLRETIVEITGVSDEFNNGEPSASSSGPDF